MLGRRGRGGGGGDVYVWGQSEIDFLRGSDRGSRAIGVSGGFWYRYTHCTPLHALFSFPKFLKYPSGSNFYAHTSYCVSLNQSKAFETLCGSISWPFFCAPISKSLLTLDTGTTCQKCRISYQTPLNVTWNKIAVS